MFTKALLWTATGVALGLILNNTIAGFLNPMLASVRINISAQTS